jgi:hypothetical protein
VVLAVAVVDGGSGPAASVGQRKKAKLSGRLPQIRFFPTSESLEPPLPVFREPDDLGLVLAVDHGEISPKTAQRMMVARGSQSDKPGQSSTLDRSSFIGTKRRRPSLGV